jgi:L,D-transpeptidase catalytic domain
MRSSRKHRQRRRLRGLLRAGAAIATTGLAVAASAQAATTPAASKAPPRAALTRLSNLHSLTRWAYPENDAVIRSDPSPRARPVGRLRFLTPDDQAELYVVLAAARTPRAGRWLQVEVPARPNGRRGWVPRSALSSLNVVHSYLLVDEGALRATLFREGRAIFSAPVGVGKPTTVTPTGEFYVLEKLRSIGSPIYGPFAIGTSAYAPTLSEWPGGGVVGIHGTNEPQLIPGRPSHGCIRMRDEDITELWSLIALGTPIEIT